MDTEILTRHLSRVRALHEHPSYSSNLDYSDKLILPPSVFVSLCRAGPQALLQVTSLRHKSRSIVCGALEFTAEEDTVYCPAHVLRILGFYSAFHIKGGLSVTPITTPTPRLTAVALETAEFVSEEEARQGLVRFTYLQKADSLTIWVNGRQARVKVKRVEPQERCLISDEGFSVEVSVKKQFALQRVRTRNTKRGSQRVQLKTPRALQVKRLSISQPKALSPQTFAGSNQCIYFRVSVKRIPNRFLATKD